MRPAAAERAAPYAPAFFLLLAAAAGGLRSPAGWFAFGAALLAWTLLRRPAAAAPGPWTPLFFGWLGLAALFSPDPSVSLPAFAGQGLLGLFFLLAAAGGKGEEGWLRAALAAGAIAAAAMLFQAAAFGHVTGLIGRNPNYSAAFCAAAFPVALLRLSSAGTARGGAAAGALALLLAAGIAVSGSRGAAGAAFLAAAAGLAAGRRWRWLAGLCLAAAAAAALLPGQALEGLLKLGDPRAYARPRLWGAALEAAAASPLLGWGPGRFAAAFELFKFPFPDGVSYYGHATLSAHGELFNLAAEAGFPAVLLFLAAAGAGLLRGGAGRLPFRLLALAPLLQGLADVTFYSGAVGLLFWGSLGFASAGAGDAGKRGGFAPAAACALLLAALLAGPAAGGAARAYRASAVSAETAGGPLAQALPARLLLEEPYNVFALARLGRAASAAGDGAGASAAWRRALELEPAFGRARLELAALLAAAGENGEACAQLRLLPGPRPGEKLGAYPLALLDFDRGAAAELEKKTCGKKKTGAGTASRPKTSSKATR